MRAWCLGAAAVRGWLVLGCLLALGAAACGQAGAQTGAATATSSSLPATITPVTFTPTPYPLSPDPSPSLTPYPLTPTPSRQSPALSPVPSPTACPPDLCVYSGVFPFQRPIGPNDRQAIDPSYRFGSTQGGKRDPHHGVELLNSYGTPVLAAADGTVVVAGDDLKTRYGPYFNAYGNLVVIQHDLPGYTEPVFTVYGHLSKVLVEAGRRVTAGQLIGAVGLSGAATGSHLHFEVRFGENTYQASRNPELWLAPLPAQGGRPGGALAGRILDAYGQYLKVPNIVIEYLPERDGPAAWEAYVGTYEEKQMVGQPPWQESFALGDLPAGWYRISFVQSGMQSRRVQVLPGELTVVTFELK
jgi:murein DD-endopeptidase MepM/ murein hydrolase activator NlpD